MTATNEAFRRSNRTFDPMDYYTPGPGKDGAVISGRISTDLRHLINVLVSGRETPFDTPGEFVRAACTWFMAEIAPKFREQKFEEGLKHFYHYLEGAQRDATLLNLSRLQAVAKDKILKLVAIGAYGDAALEYRKMLEVAEATHPRYGSIMRTWAATEAAFHQVRPIVAQMELEESAPDLPQHKCADCGHRYDAHNIVVDDEGEEHVDCRKTKGGKKGACGCLKWQRERREVGRE